MPKKPASESPKPQSRSIRTVAIDLNPATYSDQFDLTTELDSNRDFYTTTDGECVTLRPVPGYLTESLERYKFSFSSHRPGMNAISSACIWGGLQSLRQQESIKELSVLQERLRKANHPSDTDTDRYDIVVNWFDSFPCDVFRSEGSKPKSLNVSLPDKIKGPLAGMAKSLSMSQGTLGAVLIADIIREQDTTLSGHRRKLDDSVKTFLILCQARLGALESVLEMLGKR